MTTKTETHYQHLEPRPGSNYRQLFLKGRRIRAAVVDEAIHGPDPFTPEEFAKEYQVPLEAVLEALDYVAQNRPLIEQERDHEAARLRARGLLGPNAGMKFLIDENLSSPRLASRLRAQGHDPVLAQDVGLLSVADARVLDLLDRPSPPRLDSGFRRL